MTETDPRGFTPELELALTAAAEQAAASAADVDRGARLPTEALQVLRDTNLMAAIAPREFGGLGLGLPALVRIAERLARSCGSSAMIWAMHQAQLACLVRHHRESPLLRKAVAERWLIASVTSERGVGGDLRSSLSSLADGPDGRQTLEKDGTTVSYGAGADAYLVTARRTADADTGNQVAVLVTRDQVELEQQGEWDVLGMRGTCSPAFRIRAAFQRDQILPVPFRTVAAETMVPVSHLLWAGVWSGLAAESVHRAVRSVRGRAPADPTAAVPELARAHLRLTAMRAQLDAAVRAVEPVFDAGREPTLGLGAQLNALKISVSEGAVETAHLALQVCGMAGFAERGPYSVARILRDAYSAPLMIGNGRLLAANARTVLLSRGER
ncbi:acyl-CoA/acyl-ACP dehydrogenase [Kitasatospora sp. NBC_01287]|uniref:acyl-CoA dehydrogenase family protein n=1 Tax=Kitasatospora sp. NBC_01287 TaxID=2903573 RepID=UPI00224F9E02|nr:acyl-CoA dehydrogenase family protein [Kitasatospora sp. NBC_01287]MCX4745036.1 acyl-CoA/acyl-ACP dehydrogenase [Kitasatospora sp. NBC_01287]